MHSLDTEMSNEEIIYLTPTFIQSPSESPNRLKPRATQRPGKSDDKELSVPWRLVAVTLGFLCLLLLMTSIVLGTMIFRCIQGKQQCETLQNHIIQRHNLTEQLLANKTLAPDILKIETLEQINKLFKEKNSCHRKKTISSKSMQVTGKLNEESWSCCGENCYLFTKEVRNWNGCKRVCQNYGLSLLKIDDINEKDFLQSQADKNNYWIGLSYNESKRKWEWIDNCMPGLNPSVVNMTPGRGQCAFLTSTRIDIIDCSRTYNCICEDSIFLAFKALREKASGNIMSWRDLPNK